MAALLLGTSLFASEVELKNFEEPTLTSKGEKAHVMKEGRLAEVEQKAKYKISFDITKDKGIKNGYISVYAYLPEELKAQYNNEKLVRFVKVGDDAPDDGQTYKCEGIFEVPDNEWFIKNVRLSAYNSYAPEGLVATYKNVKIEKIDDENTTASNIAPYTFQYPIVVEGKGAKVFNASTHALPKVQAGKKYAVKFEIKKEGDSKGGCVGFTGSNSDKKTVVILTNIGSDIPADGEFHEVETTLSIPNDLKNFKAYLYNRYATGNVTFKDFSIKEISE